MYIFKPVAVSLTSSPEEKENESDLGQFKYPQQCRPLVFLKQTDKDSYWRKKKRKIYQSYLTSVRIASDIMEDFIS